MSEPEDRERGCGMLSLRHDIAIANMVTLCLPASGLCKTGMAFLQDSHFTYGLISENSAFSIDI